MYRPSSPDAVLTWISREVSRACPHRMMASGTHRTQPARLGRALG